MSTDQAPARAGPGDPVIELAGLSIRFRQQAVLRDIDLTIRRGETVCIIGESGCGKTVMLKLIVGLLRPTEGEVIFEGTPLHTLSDTALSRMRLRVGFLFQQAALFDSLNVYDNVAFGLRAKGGVSEADVRARVRERQYAGVEEDVLPAEPGGAADSEGTQAEAEPVPDQAEVPEGEEQAAEGEATAAEPPGAAEAAGPEGEAEPAQAAEAEPATAEPEPAEGESGGTETAEAELAEGEPPAGEETAETEEGSEEAGAKGAGSGEP